MPRRPKRDPLSEAVSRLRVARGWTTYRLAKEARLNIQTVLRIEGGAGARWPTVVKLADALGVSTEAFRDGGRQQPA
jgi:transcriptional regulator with XRE-family HTH domain